jgi:hypothetical protein
MANRVVGWSDWFATSSYKSPLSLRERAGVRANYKHAMHPHPTLSQRERVLKLFLASELEI